MSYDSDQRARRLLDAALRHGPDGCGDPHCFQTPTCAGARAAMLRGSGWAWTGYSRLSAYAPGDRVTHDGASYVCTDRHDPRAGHDPGDEDRSDRMPVELRAGERSTGAVAAESSVVAALVDARRHIAETTDWSDGSLPSAHLARVRQLIETALNAIRGARP